MAAPPLLHSVLVTQPLSQAAIARLGTFFSVELRTDAPVPGSDELVHWLQGKAGVIADTRYQFDAALVARLPHLKAVCNLDGAHHNLDLVALTRAGIRATSLPWANSEQRVPGKWSRRVRFDHLDRADVSEKADDLVTEQLIASLGFGRNSWHPRNLLNDEVQCESCC